MNKDTQNIPQEVLDIIKSGTIFSKLEAIGTKYDLHLDQLGSLDVATRMVMIGNIKSEDFVNNIAKELEIEKDVAEKIAVDINTEILMTIRESLRKMQEKIEQPPEPVIVKPFVPPAPPKPVTPPAPRPVAQIPKPPTPQPIPPVPKPPVAPSTPKPFVPPPQPVSPPPVQVKLSDIEKVGNFTIERRPASESTQYNDKSLKKEDVLKDLEDISKLKGNGAKNFVDHLLANPISAPQKVEIKKVEAIQQDRAGHNTPAPKKSGDPYREPIE